MATLSNQKLAIYLNYGMLHGGNVAIANQVPQISEFPKYEGFARDLQLVAQHLKRLHHPQKNLILN